MRTGYILGILSSGLLASCSLGTRPAERASSLVSVESQVRYDIEVYNPARCPADVYLSNKAGTTGRSLSSVPAGSRQRFVVVSPYAGTVSALALRENGTECEPGMRTAEVRVLSTSEGGTP